MSVPTDIYAPGVLAMNGSDGPPTTREARRSQERRRLFESISSSRSNSRRYSAGDSLQPFIRDPQSAYPQTLDHDGIVLEPLQEESPRDPRDDGGPSQDDRQRPSSPYTKTPTVDFDGLSWPSELPCAVIGGSD